MFTAKSHAVKRLDIRPTDRIIVTCEPLVLRQEIVRQESFPDHKPFGLWYGCGRAWINWIDTTGVHNSFEHVYRLNLQPETLLRISTRAEFDAFDREYAVGHPKLAMLRYPDWKRVAEVYSGIEICPYRFEQRTIWIGYFAVWYGTWDVASGCVWDTHIIRGVEQLL